MNHKRIVTILLLAVSTFGCGLVEKLKPASGTNANVQTPTPAPIAAATPTVAPTATPDNAAAAAAQLGKNLLAFAAGANIAGRTSEFNQYKADNLIDESSEGWITGDRQIENQSVTLELPARTTLKTIVFDTKRLGSEGEVPKDVTVEVSDVSATEGFQTILEAVLAGDDKSVGEQGVDNQMFPVAREVAGRFVRYTAKNNYGSPEEIKTKELRGYGDQEPVEMIKNISGTYQAKHAGLFYFKQDGAAVIGCKDSDDGIIEGTVEGRVLVYRLRNGSEVKSSGVFSFTPDGQKFISFYWLGVKKSFDTDDLGEKKSDRIGKCRNLPNLDGAEDTAKTELEKNLAGAGRAVLYGINFDFNSDVIRAESKPTLEKVLAILKTNSDWKMQIEGHTDNVGGDAFNQTLSEKRAAAVKQYLTAGGISADRLTSAGYGLSKPLAPNDSEAERAQNRRVELVKQ